MADLVMKQAVAVIDRRTTMVCLHVEGQTQPIDVPFDTLNGPFDAPPFHVHCRTQSVPWMPGFGDGLRGEANAEILTRPAREQRMLKPGYDGPLPPKPHDPPPSVAAAGPVPRPPSLPGGAARLADVPPTQARDWILAHPERFEVTSNGGGISETHWVKDLVTGDRYVLKKGQYHAESVNEIAGTRFAEQIGLPGVARIAGPMEDGNGWLLLDHAEDVMPGYQVVGTGGGHSQMAKLLPRLEDPKDAIRKLLSDFVLDEADAKGGNTLLLSADGGKTVRLVPIDRSLSLMGWRGAVEPGKTSLVAGDWSLAARLRVRDLRGYMKTRGSPKGILELVSQMAETGGATLVRETYDEVLTAMRSINVDDLFKGLDGAHADEAKTLIRHRIDVLEKERRTILKQMGVRDAPAADPAEAAIAKVVDPPPVSLDVHAVQSLGAEFHTLTNRLEAMQAEVDDAYARMKPTLDGKRSFGYPYAAFRRDQLRIEEIKAEGRALAEQRWAAFRSLQKALGRTEETLPDLPPEDAARWADVRKARTLPGQKPLDPADWQKRRDRYVVDDDQTIRQNQSLRSDSPSAAAKSWGRSMDGLVNSQEAAHDTVVFRGAALTWEQAAEYRPGAVFRDPGVISTAEDTGQPTFYAGERAKYTVGERIVMLEIRVPKGQPMVDVAYGEFVLPRQTRMRVRSVHDGPDARHVVMEVF